MQKLVRSFTALLCTSLAGLQISILHSLNTKSTQQELSIIRLQSVKSTSQSTLNKIEQNKPHQFTTTQCSCDCPETQCNPDISFGIADIKFDGNTLKILELGEGTRSMFEGFDSINGWGSMWQRIWQFLFDQNKDIFFVDYDLNTPDKRKAIAYTALIEHSGRAFNNLRELAHHQPLLALINRAQRPLVVIRHEAANQHEIKKFNRDFPQLLICNAVIAPFVNNKQFTDLLFTPPLRASRPYAICIPKRDAPGMAKQILTECPAKAFVIKPLTGCKGEGIIFTPRAQLASTLTKLFGPRQRGPQSPTAEFIYWDTDRHNMHALIESCEQSKPVIVDGKKYDATLRTVFGLTHADGLITTTIFGSYWKLPVKSRDEKGTLLEKKLSHISTTHRSAAPLSPDDETTINSSLPPLLASLYSNMIKNKTRLDRN